jgi:putative transposase
VPKYRKKVLYGKIRTFLGLVFHELADQRQSTILEGHMIQDHVHILIQIYGVGSCWLYQREKYDCGRQAICRAEKNNNGESFGLGDMRCQLLVLKKPKSGKYIRNQEQLEGKGSKEDWKF